jgi:hypothetical protein
MRRLLKWLLLSAVVVPPPVVIPYPAPVYEW